MPVQAEPVYCVSNTPFISLLILLGIREKSEKMQTIIRDSLRCGVFRPGWATHMCIYSVYTYPLLICVPLRAMHQRDKKDVSGFRSRPAGVCVCVCINGSGVLQNAQGHTRRSDNGVCVNFTGSVGSPRGRAFSH